MGTWSSGVGKFRKKDSKQKNGWLWQWLKDNWRGFWNASLIEGRCKKNCNCKCKKD